MKRSLKNIQFSPYLTGVIIGLSFLIAYIVFSKTLPTCASYVKIGALINSSFAQNQALYFKDFLSHAPHWFDWPLALATGIFVGSYLASKLSESKAAQETLSKKQKTLAFLGGAVVLFGSRFAGGCLSGHIVSSASQMAMTSHMFLLGLVVIGLPSAYITSKLIKEDN